MITHKTFYLIVYYTSLKKPVTSAASLVNMIYLKKRFSSYDFSVRLATYRGGRRTLKEVKGATKFPHNHLFLIISASYKASAPHLL